MLDVDEPYGPISWFLGAAWVVVIGCVVTWAWLTQSHGWIRAIAFVFPLLAGMLLWQWTREWRRNEALRKAERKKQRAD